MPKHKSIRSHTLIIFHYYSTSDQKLPVALLFMVARIKCKRDHPSATIQPQPRSEPVKRDGARSVTAPSPSSNVEILCVATTRKLPYVTRSKALLLTPTFSYTHRVVQNRPDNITKYTIHILCKFMLPIRFYRKNPLNVVTLRLAEAQVSYTKLT